MANAREKRERREVDASTWVESFSLGNNHCIRLPPGVALFNPKKEGTWFTEFIPYDVGQNNPDKAPGEYYFKRKYYAHRVPGRGSENPTFCCPKCFGKPCCVCQQAALLGQDPKSKELVKGLSRRPRDLWLVHVWEEKEKGVQVWDISDWLFSQYSVEKIKKADPDKRPLYMRFADPDHGWTVRMSGVEKPMPEGKPVIHYSDIEFRERKGGVPDKLLKHGICLDELLIDTPDEILRNEFLIGTPTTFLVGQGQSSGAAAQEPAGWESPTDSRSEVERPSSRTREAEPETTDDGWETPTPEKPKEELVIAKGESYSFDYPEGKAHTGDVIDINRGKELVRIKCPDQDTPYTVAFADLRPADPAPDKAKAAPPPADDGWGEEPPPETTPRRGKK